MNLSMDNSQGFKSLQDQIQAALVSATRTTNHICLEDLSFQRSLNPSLAASLDEKSSRLLALSSSLIRSAASISNLDSLALQDIEDVDNNWQSVVDVVDSLLEKADTCLDDYTGVIKRKTQPTTEQSPSQSKKHRSLDNAFRTQNLLKPQLAFLNKPDNTATEPWKPILVSKPHAITPLTQSVSTFTDELERIQYKHPYETEILEMRYPDTMYHNAEPISSQDVGLSKATFIDTFDGVLTMLAELKNAKEIAVDLEHHDYRSYIGLVSLMQISTREKDWIVDTLKPWRQDLQVLNEAFADPKIIKVFHGAYMDIVWLQRDLGLYVVGLFDTYHASRVLGYPGASLAYLLKRFVDFDANKKYQLADWRIRPLPDEMFFYAMTDTHFLLYIFDKLRNELVENSNTANPEENKIEIVLQRSKETSLLRFERQIYEGSTGQGPAGWHSLLLKAPVVFNNEQFAVFRAVHAWRDQIARKDDDSVHYVMPNKVIFTLAKLMPVDMASLYGAVHPISDNVKPRAAELLAIIKSAKATGKDGPSMTDILRSNPVAAVVKASGPLATSISKEQELAFKSTMFSTNHDQLRTDKSMFWGGAFGSSIWNHSSAFASHGTNFKLAAPMPQIASEPYIDLISDLTGPSHLENERKASQRERNMHASKNEHNVGDEAFTIKSGRKREAEITETDLAVFHEPLREYDISFNGDEENSREKVARKADRKAQKKLAKAAQKLASSSSANGNQVDLREEDAFDYSNADSVLYRKRKEANADGSKRERPFDPYAKSSNAPKGLRKLQTEQAGKSITFKGLNTTTRD